MGLATEPIFGNHYPMAKRLLLSVDTSCDESCCAIMDLEARTLLADVVFSHVGAMKEYGGIVPEIASREHLKALPLAIEQALAKAGCALSEIDWFSVTNRPGLIGALLVGVAYIKSLAFACGKPFSVMDHVEAHLYSPLLAQLEGDATPPFPWIALVVSGGHTEMFLVRDLLEATLLGGTLDDAAGEAFDKIGKLLGFPYPAGPALDRWVGEKATAEDRRAIAFPRPQGEGFHFSFSGLKTAVSRHLNKHPIENELQRLQIAASAQEAILETLVEKARFAQKQFGVEQIVVTGGVACNSRLREILCDAYFPKRKHCTDNAAMIALLTQLYSEKPGGLIAAPWTASAHACR